MADRGVVKWFNEEKGFGFITRSDENGEVFVHKSDVTHGPLQQGDTVEFSMIKGERGLKAKNVRVVTAAGGAAGSAASASSPRANDQGFDSWLAGSRGRASKKVLSFKNPPRTFGFVKPEQILMGEMLGRLKEAWPDLEDEEVLRWPDTLKRLLESGEEPEGK